jgi:putative membrane protein
VARLIVLASVASLAIAAAAGAQPGAGAPSTKEFVTAASQSDEFERREGRLAEQDAVNPKVKAFASDMVRDHTKTTDNLHAAIEKAGMPVPPPPPLSHAQQGQLDTLRALHGAAFDHAYIDQQIHAHEQALSLMQAYARGGDNSGLRTAAQQTVPLIRHHLEMARALRGS